MGIRVLRCRESEVDFMENGGWRSGERGVKTTGNRDFGLGTISGGKMKEVGNRWSRGREVVV